MFVFFSLFWLGAISFYRPRDEPDDGDGREEDAADGAKDREDDEDAEDGVDIVLRLSKPRALDWRASEELSEPPNAPPPAALPPDEALAPGAGLETVGEELMPLERFCHVGEGALIRIPREESRATPAGFSRCAGMGWLTPSGGAAAAVNWAGRNRRPASRPESWGAAGAVNWAGRNVSAANPRSGLRAAPAEARAGPCQRATPRGATRLRGG